LSRSPRPGAWSSLSLITRGSPLRVILRNPDRSQHSGRAVLQRRDSCTARMWALTREMFGTFNCPAANSQPFQPLLHNCEWPVNPTCGKNIHHPRTKAVIAEDTTCCVSLLTGTISGSNFAIP
jgi:hypothetical protein